VRTTQNGGQQQKFTSAKLFKRLDFSGCPTLFGHYEFFFSNLLKVPELIGQHKIFKDAQNY
jgi:hypothetical protein